MTAPKPERALIRRVSPFAVPAALLAYVVGAAFGGAALTLVPAIVGLLIFEAKALSGRMQADLWTFDEAGRR